jgi:hypothetical protein
MAGIFSACRKLRNDSILFTTEAVFTEICVNPSNPRDLRSIFVNFAA